MTITPDSVQQIHALALARSRALVDKDAEAMRRILSDAFTYVNASGRSFTREEYIARYVTSPSVRWHSQAIRDAEVWPLGDYAVFTCLVDDDATFDGQLLHATFRSVYLYVRHGNGWQCLGGSTREA